jgi:hypothetical protein
MIHRQVLYQVLYDTLFYIAQQRDQKHHIQLWIELFDQNLQGQRIRKSAFKLKLIFSDHAWEDYLFGLIIE